MRYLPVILLLALVLITSGCTTTKPVVNPQPTITIVATPTPEPTLTPPLPGTDPIIGAWENGMVFNPDGSVGDDRNVSWKANTMLNYSYFVTTESRGIKDEKSGRTVDPSALSIEWVYNPYSDTIHIRDSNIGVHRVLLVTAPAKPAPAAT
jgi:hypothetical protein